MHVHLKIVRILAPAIAMGCSVIIRPSNETPHTALALGVLAEEAGIPKNLIHILLTTSRYKLQTALSEKFHERTMQVAEEQSQVCGNRFFIVFPEAKIDATVSELCEIKFRCTCVYINRIFVHRRIVTEFQEKLVSEAKQIRSGDPLDCNSFTQGPLQTKEAVDQCERQVKDALKKGAKELLKGGREKAQEQLRMQAYDEARFVKLQNGYWFAPTVLGDMKDDMLIAEEEVLGPIFAIFTFDREEEVVIMAKERSTAALGGYIFSGDENQIERVSQQLVGPQQLIKKLSSSD